MVSLSVLTGQPDRSAH